MLDVQFLPDVDIPCPDCGGIRYAPDATRIRLDTAEGDRSLAELLRTTIADAASLLAGLPKVPK